MALLQKGSFTTESTENTEKITEFFRKLSVQLILYKLDLKNLRALLFKRLFSGGNL